MLRTDVEVDLLNARREGAYVFPDYEEYSFANVNPTLLSLLGASTDRTLPDGVFDGVETDVDRVVVCFLDGYGWEQWKRDYEAVPLLSLVTERGTVTPLTSIYPSETAAATTTFHTGRTPVEHGLLGWWQYVAEASGVVQALPFATLDGEPAGEAFAGLEQADLFDGESLYGCAADRGIESRLCQPVSGGPGTAGAEISVWEGAPDVAVALRRGLEAEDGPDYLYGYFPQVDAVAHEVGNDGDRYRARLESVTESLRRELVERVDADAAERTLLVLVADHGIVDTPPEANVDLSGAEWLWDDLARDDGEPIPPVGSPRNLHLFLQNGTVERVREAVESRVPCRTFTRSEAVERGLFGDREPSDLFRRRCGDLIVVHRDQGLWWEDDELALAGMHGGLSREEMLVPFAAARLSELQ